MFTKPLKIIVCLVIYFAGSYMAFSQTSYSLLANPSVQSVGMGFTGVSMPLDDGFGWFHNPSQLVMCNTGNYLKIVPFGNYNKDSDYWYFYFPDKAYSIQAGVDLSKYLAGVPLTFGAAYSHQENSFGNWTRIDDSGRIIGKFTPNEKFNSLSLAFGFDYYVKIGIGASFKLIESNALPVLYRNIGLYDEYEGTAYDLGVMLDVPILKKLRIAEGFSADLNAFAGYTYSNAGSGMKLTNSINGMDYEEEFLSYAALGYGAKASLNYKLGKTEFKALEASWSSQANDRIGYWDTQGNFQRKGITGDINIWDNVILCKSTRQVESRNGWDLKLFETVGISGGRRIIDWQSTLYNNQGNGYAIYSDGLFKLIGEILGIDFIKDIPKYVSLSYHFSTVENDYSNSIIFMNKKYNLSSFQITIRLPL